MLGYPANLELTGKTLKSLMKKPAGEPTANLKRPASKKDAAKKQKHDERETFKTGSLQIRVYKKAKSVAAASKFHNVDQNRNAATKLMKMLEKLLVSNA